MTKTSGTRFMLSKMLSNRVFAAAFVVAAAMLSLMYYDTVTSSVVARAVFPAPHSAGVSVWLGLIIALGITSNVYVMRVIMGGGQEAMKAASKTVLSMVAGLVGCVSSIASVLLSLGVGAGSGALAFLSANVLPFFAVALVMSLISIKLAAGTLTKVSDTVKF